jgi:mannosyltransferase OCH1-like enzyme
VTPTTTDSAMCATRLWGRARDSPWTRAVVQGELPRRRVPVLTTSRTHESNSSAIPCVVHQTWVDNKFGRTHADGILRFRALNPEFTFRIWSDEERDQFIADEFTRHPVRAIYERAKFGPLSTDIWRYSVLLSRGGWYFDIKSGVSVPLPTLLPAPSTNRAVVTFEQNVTNIPPMESARRRLQHPNHVVANWGLASAPGFSLFERLLESICAAYDQYRGRTFKKPKAAILDFTGPNRLTRVIREFTAHPSFDDIAQAGIDFGGHGIYDMPGSWVRHLSLHHYASSRNAIIID